MKPHAIPTGPIETWQVRAHGRVQCVGHRDACVRHARVLGVIEQPSRPRRHSAPPAPQPDRRAEETPS